VQLIYKSLSNIVQEELSSMNFIIPDVLGFPSENVQPEAISIMGFDFSSFCAALHVGFYPW